MFAHQDMLFCASVTLLHLFGSALGTPVDASSVHVTVETIPDLESVPEGQIPDLHSAPLTPSHRAGKREAGQYAAGRSLNSVGCARGPAKRLGRAFSLQISFSWAEHRKTCSLGGCEYPYRRGVGCPSVTYVEVQVNQSSSTGRGYIVSGGVGQRNIRLVIEGYNTLFFHYQAAIYGW
uniref:Secretory glycoconjugate protein n=1 Tax=Anopheles stephensi TaxID=30069 RepID=A0A6M3YHV7_ANOST|nr:secretory glycoconjugate protein [Anopheles stephensi]